MIQLNLYYGYISENSIDANKHPDEQINELITLIKNCKENELNIYSNSPYVMFRITLLFGYSKKNIPVDKKLHGDITITNKHFEVLKDGSIIEGKYYKGMMSDECLLNDKLAESNELYSNLLSL
jgi:hypothetical protein